MIINLSKTYPDNMAEIPVEDLDLSDSESDLPSAPETASGPQKAKKKKNKKKKKPAVAAIPDNEKVAPVSGIHGKGEGFGVEYVQGSGKYSEKFNLQSMPPTVPVATMFPGNRFPQGEIMSHPLPSNAGRLEDKQKINAELFYDGTLNDIREAAEVHRQTRAYAQRMIKPGMKMVDICQMIENSNKNLLQSRGLERGFGFPTGCSLNHVAAHYTPNYGDNTILQQGDIMKIDFGTHVNGHIVDTAFTFYFDHQFDTLAEAVKDATNTGIREAGIDVRLCDIGAAIQEACFGFN